MTWKQIEARRETRLWISQIIVPTVLATVAAMNIPEVRQFVSDKTEKAKNFVSNVFHKKSS